jgi:hypothetical protein
MGVIACVPPYVHDGDGLVVEDFPDDVRLLQPAKEYFVSYFSHIPDILPESQKSILTYQENSCRIDTLVGCANKRASFS